MVHSCVVIEEWATLLFILRLELKHRLSTNTSPSMQTNKGISKQFLNSLYSAVLFNNRHDQRSTSVQPLP